MKKYFCRYLPVEGEIKEGDILFDYNYKRNKGKSYIIGIVEKIDNNRIVHLIRNVKGNTHQWSLDLNDYTQKTPPYKKVKLFLCSRDIQVGDKVKFPDSLKDTIVDTSKGLSLGSYKIYGYFKVIGEISPEATFVKEGDEFDENEFQYAIFTQMAQFVLTNVI